jgi:hypothetical protein
VGERPGQIFLRLSFSNSHLHSGVKDLQLHRVRILFPCDRFLSQPQDAMREQELGEHANVDKPMTMAALDVRMSWSSPARDTGASRGAVGRNVRDRSCDSPDSPIERDTDTFTTSISKTPVVKGRKALHQADGTASDVCPPHRPRKGHKKSRGGCFNCKKRKIKVWPPIREMQLGHLIGHTAKRNNLHATTVRKRISNANTQRQRFHQH